MKTMTVMTITRGIAAQTQGLARAQTLRAQRQTMMRTTMVITVMPQAQSPTMTTTQVREAMMKRMAQTKTRRKMRMTPTTMITPVLAVAVATLDPQTTTSVYMLAKFVSAAPRGAAWRACLRGSGGS